MKRIRALVPCAGIVLALAACGSSGTVTVTNSGGGGGTGTGGGTGSGSGSSSAAKLSQPDLVAKIEAATVELTGTIRNQVVGGSGVVIDSSQGYIVTNAHVVTGVAALQIRFNDGSTSAGRVVAKEPCDDVAVVKIVSKPDNLPSLPLGDSASMRAGDHVTAVGYPASFQSRSKEKPTATEGSISANDVSAEPDGSLPKYVSLIQHQAPINPGNSGGPLVNDQGQVVGINTLGNTLQGGRAIQGQYYAITSKHLKQVLPDLQSGKSQDDIGISVVQNATDVATALQQLGGSVDTADGLVVLGVDTGSPSDDAHLQFGDILLRLESAPISTWQDVCNVLQSRGPGQSIRFGGESAFGQPFLFTATLKLR